MSKQKDKKIVFSEEIDSSINGIALGTAFVIYLYLLFILRYLIIQ